MPIVLVGLLFGLFAVSVTSFGILAVSIFPNRYVGIAASFVAFYVIYAFTGSFPFSVNVWYLSSGVQVLNVNGFAVNYFYAIGISIWEISSNKLMNYVLYSKVYPKNVISSTTVWNAAFYSYMVSSLTVMLLGYLVYAFNVVTGKNWPGILAASNS